MRTFEIVAFLTSLLKSADFRGSNVRGEILKSLTLPTNFYELPEIQILEEFQSSRAETYMFKSESSAILGNVIRNTTMGDLNPLDLTTSRLSSGLNGKR
jgi:hypothetical protein